MLHARDLFSIGISSEIEENGATILEAGLEGSSDARKRGPWGQHPHSLSSSATTKKALRAFFFFFFFFSKQAAAIIPLKQSSCTLLSKPLRRDLLLLTLGSGEHLQERAWRWRFAMEPAAREQKKKHGMQRPSQSQSPPPSKSATTTMTPKQQSRWASTPPSSSLPTSPRASPRARRDASLKPERLQREQAQQNCFERKKKGKRAK